MADRGREQEKQKRIADKAKEKSLAGKPKVMNIGMKGQIFHIAVKEKEDNVIDKEKDKKVLDKEKEKEEKKEKKEVHPLIDIYLYYLHTATVISWSLPPDLNLNFVLLPCFLLEEKERKEGEEEIQ